MSDSLGHLSKKTRERAFVLIKNASSIGLDVGTARLTPNYDYMSYYFTNELDYIIVFCTPDCYLVEIWEESNGSVDSAFLAVRNIRHFLQFMKKSGYHRVAIATEDISPECQDGEKDLRDWLQDLDEDSDN